MEEVSSCDRLEEGALVARSQGQLQNCRLPVVRSDGHIDFSARCVKAGGREMEFGDIT